MNIQTKFIVAIIFLLSSCSFALANTNTENICKDIPPPTIVQQPIIFDAARITLTQKYRSEHYGIQSESITIKPQMIVLHATEEPDLETSWEIFKNPFLGSDRTDISKGGNLNVSVPFLVDKDGSIYQLMPINWMARHTIGLNNIAIGIENVGEVNHAEDLSEKQVESNVKLICFLKQRYPGIEYLIGHYEYGQFRDTPLWEEKDKSYFTEKHDPGPKFMKEVRKRVSGLGLLPQ